MRFAKNRKVEFLANFAEVGPHHAKRQRFAYPPAVSAIGRAADHRTLVQDRLGTTNVGSIGFYPVYFQRDEAIGKALSLPCDERVAADELSLDRKSVV